MRLLWCWRHWMIIKGKTWTEFSGWEGLVASVTWEVHSVFPACCDVRWASVCPEKCTGCCWLRWRWCFLWDARRNGGFSSWSPDCPRWRPSLSVSCPRTPAVAAGPPAACTSPDWPPGSRLADSPGQTFGSSCCKRLLWSRCRGREGLRGNRCRAAGAAQVVFQRSKVMFWGRLASPVRSVPGTFKLVKNTIAFIQRKQFGSQVVMDLKTQAHMRQKEQENSVQKH